MSTPGAPTVATTRAKRLYWSLVVGCAGLVIYGTLFPFVGWRVPAGFPWSIFATRYDDLSAPDVLANILLYVPLGFVLFLGRRWRALPLILLAAVLLSLALEIAQAFLPGRVSSLLDTAMNVFGAGLGAVAALVLQWSSATYIQTTMARLKGDQAAWLGIAALAAWGCAQLIPFVPSLDIGNLKDGLKPLWYALQGSEPVSLWRCLVYVAATAALTVAGASALRITRWGGAAAAGLLAVLPLKVLVVGRQLSAEAAAGTLLGVALGLALWAAGRRRALIAAAVLVPAYIAAEALQPGGPGSVTHSFNWIPLRAQLVQPINGMANLADDVWPLMLLACICLRLGVRSLWPLLPIVALLLFGVEWAQRWVPGRYPGITTVLAGTVAWIAAAAYAGRQPRAL